MPLRATQSLSLTKSADSFQVDVADVVNSQHQGLPSNHVMFDNVITGISVDLFASQLLALLAASEMDMMQ